MTFADLLAGEAIFLDANTLVYHFVSDPLYGAACSQLLHRIENQELPGLTSTKIKECAWRGKLTRPPRIFFRVEVVRGNRRQTAR